VIAELSLVEYLLALGAVTLGATVQGSVGFGAALIAVPAIALVVPDALPVTVIVWVAPLCAAMALRERGGIDRSGVGWATLGRVPGSAMGAWVVNAVAASTLSILAGGAVLLAVTVSLLSVTVPPRPGSSLVAGFASGLMGTATSVGGPPVALLYQHEPGPVVRSTLAAMFTVGTVMSFSVLALTGAVEGWQVVLALALQPGLVLGLLLSRVVVRRLDGRGWLRPAVLAVAGVTALLAVVRGLCGG
jgi:uncharacterized protein